MCKCIELKKMANAKGICINLKHFGLCIAFLPIAMLSFHKCQCRNIKGCYVAAYKLMIGVAIKRRWKSAKTNL